MFSAVLERTDHLASSKILVYCYINYSSSSSHMKYRMLIKMDSEAFVAASLLWVDLIVIHLKISDTLGLALYQIIDRNWQKYE
jgi:hypothetical protein